ncbi:hypothetical protein AWZ03_013867 [Drosophila navojoa]|uniref:Calponin-homology (CH) domain-containing protein n=1 Tax=Drosophila navojoa TaxID=7232 RepID=A0A484AV28_DRONA|nr:uncharacterized protein LOC115565005 [Drosophila navojoa]TDG39710.1 hypothetical protein AWZ03_013867 [Drosophila navojoa]
MHSISQGQDEARQLLQWIKGLVHSPRCHKLKDLSNGVVWCRLMGKLRPGALASILVINRPANANDSMHNYMLLESAFYKAKIPWYFDSSALVAGNTDELYRLAKSFAEISMTANDPFPLPMPPFGPNGQDRRPAGENESSVYSTSTQPSIEPTELEPSEEAVLSEMPQTPLSSAEQLKQRLEAMFRSQQAAVEAYFAEQCQSATALPAAIKMKCFCNKCQSQVRALVDMSYSMSNLQRPLV